MVVDEEAALLHHNVDEETRLLLHPNSHRTTSLRLLENPCLEEEAALLHPNSYRPTSLRLLENPCLPCAVIVFVIAATILAYQIKVILLDT